MRFSKVIIAVIAAFITFATIKYMSGYYPFDIFSNVHAEKEGSYVKFSGHVMGSYYCKGRLIINKNQHTINVRMKKRFICPRQVSGNFLYYVPVTSETEFVSYGDEQITVAKLP